MVRQGLCIDDMSHRQAAQLGGWALMTFIYLIFISQALTN